VRAPLFAVFDGHGGKAAAVAAAKHLVATLASEVGSVAGAPPVPAHPLAAAVAAAGAAPPDGVTAADAAAWAAQDAVAAALPPALVAAFRALHARLAAATPAGTTATAVAFVGNVLITANCGDSLAVLDTGSEILTLTPSHRLEDSPAEVARLLAGGASVGPADVNGVAAGPPRAWPGGLAMARSLGDRDAHAAVTPDPDVRAITLPAGGCRVILASDGLWDAATARASAQRARGLPASRAASELVHMALRSRGLRDDVSVLVIDALPASAGDAKLPPALAKQCGPLGPRPPSGGANAPRQAPSLTLHRPLEESSPAWLRGGWERRAAALAAAAADADAAAAAAAVAIALAARSDDDEGDAPGDGDDWEPVAPRRPRGRKGVADAPPPAATPPTDPEDECVVVDGVDAAPPGFEAPPPAPPRSAPAPAPPQRQPGRKHSAPPSPDGVSTSPTLPRAAKGARPEAERYGRGRGRGGRGGGVPARPPSAAATGPENAAPAAVPAARARAAPVVLTPPAPPAAITFGTVPADVGLSKGRYWGRGRGSDARTAPARPPSPPPPSSAGLSFGSFSPPPPGYARRRVPAVPTASDAAPAPAGESRPPAADTPPPPTARDDDKPKRRRPPPHMRKHMKEAAARAAKEAAAPSAA